MLSFQQLKSSQKVHMPNYIAKTQKTSCGRIYKILQKQPFSKGCNRYSFLAQIVQGPCKGQKGVVKVFIQKKMRNADQIKADIKVSQIAKKYAVQFSDKLGDDHKLKVRESQAVKIQKVYQACEYFSAGDRVAVQRFIKPKFQRWTTCHGDECTKSSTLNAFEHFVYVKSNGKRMICDFQGGKEGSHYILTDPTMSSTIDNGIHLNGAQKTIKKVMARHKCNQLCHKLKLPKH